MSYGEDLPSRWSACSRRDFQAHYNQVLDKAKGEWCLPAADRNFKCSNGNCGGSGSGGNITLNYSKFSLIEKCIFWIHKLYSYAAM